jgi:hypothetical protein
MSPILSAVLGALVVQIVAAIPGLVHWALSPSPTSKWGAILDRARKWGFDPAAFEPVGTRLATAAVVAVASGAKASALVPLPDGSTISVQTIGRLS